MRRSGGPCESCSWPVAEIGLKAGLSGQRTHAFPINKPPPTCGGGRWGAGWSAGNGEKMN